jgi:hypothetical protein
MGFTKDCRFVAAAAGSANASVRAMIAAFDATHDTVFQGPRECFLANLYDRQVLASTEEIFRDRARQRRARASGGVGLAAEGI